MTTCLVLCVFLTLAADEVSAVADGFQADWAKQRKSVRTARIRADFYLFMPVNDKAISLKQLEKLYGKLLRDRLTALEVKKAIDSKFPRNDWVDIELILDGEKSRSIMLKDGKLFRDEAFDGRYATHYDASSNQASVFDGQSGLYMYSLADVSYLPQFAGRLSESMPINSESDGVIRMSNSAGSLLMVERSTSGILRCAASNGASDVLQYGFRRYADDVVLPTISISAQSNEPSKGNVSLLFAFIIKSATFNDKLPEDAFCVKALAGTNVVEFPANSGQRGGRYIMTVADSDEDVVTQWQRNRTRRLKPKKNP